MIGIRHCPRCELRFSTASELEHHVADDHAGLAAASATPATAPGSTAPIGHRRHRPASPLMAWLPRWMAALGNRGAERNAARAIDDPRTAALAVERQLAPLDPSRVSGSAGLRAAGRPSLSPPASTHGAGASISGRSEPTGRTA